MSTPQKRPAESDPEDGKNSAKHSKLAVPTEEDTAEDISKMSSSQRTKRARMNRDNIFITSFLMVPDEGEKFGDEPLKPFKHHHSGKERHTFKILHDRGHKAILQVVETDRMIHHQYQIPIRLVEHVIVFDSTIVFKLTHGPLTTCGFQLMAPKHKHKKVFYLPYHGMIPICEISKGAAPFSRTLVLRGLDNNVQRIFSSLTRWLGKPPINISPGEPEPAPIEGVDFNEVRNLANDLAAAEAKWRAERPRGARDHELEEGAEEDLDTSMGNAGEQSKADGSNADGAVATAAGDATA